MTVCQWVRIPACRHLGAAGRRTDGDGAGCLLGLLFLDDLPTHRIDTQVDLLAAGLTHVNQPSIIVEFEFV